MASKTSVELIDDITGDTAHDTVLFGLDGVAYTIDLSAENAAELRNRLADFVTHATRVKLTRGVTTRRAAPALTRDQNQAIREWARGQGEKVNERGRIPSELIVRFQEAHTTGDINA